MCTSRSMDEIVLTLLKSVEPHILKTQNPVERFDSVYSCLLKSPTFINNVPQEKQEKSDSLSLEFRNLGNDLYIREKKYLQALECYTKSIAFAETGSPYLALAYGNRSAILFHRKFFKECLEDIERALSKNYPDNLKEKLEKRKVSATKLLPTQKPTNYYHPIEPFVKNPRIPAAADNIEIQKNEKYGRHIIATKNIKIGEIISAETSYCHIINPESKFVHCHECLELCFNPIPCQSCTTALYCGEECLNQAYENFHKYECDFTPILHKKPLLFIKMAVKGLREEQNTTDTVPDDGLYYSNRFKEISKLITHENSDDLTSHGPTVLACFAYHALKNNTNFKSDFDLNSIDTKLKMLLYQTSKIDSYNPFSIKKIRYASINITSKRVGSAIYAFTSLYNHSCVPTCEFFHHGTMLVTRATSNIKKGEQVTVSYGISFSTTDIRYRRLRLKKQYLFDCDCRACADEWPVYDRLPMGKQLTFEFEMKASLNKFDDSDENKKLLAELLQDAIKFAKTLEKYRPCQNYLKLQNMIEEMYTYQACKDVEF